MPELKVLIPREDVARRVRELGAQITKDFAGQSLTLVGVLKGAAIFLSDLARNVDLDASFDFIGVSSYGNRPAPSQGVKRGWGSNGGGELAKNVAQRKRGKKIILVEGILDPGLTMTYQKNLLMARQPRCLKVAALLNNPSRRKLPLEGDYIGFKIPDEFVVGYGLDYAEKY